MAEELGFEQVLLKGRAVDFHEVARRPQRVVVDRPGDELLAGAGFAADEARRVALRDLLDHVEDALQRLARADDPIELVDVLLGVAEVVELVLHALHFERLLDLDLHLLDLERLLHVVERPVLHRFDRGGHRAERRHQDHGGRRMQRLRRAQHVEAVAAAHLQVAQHDVEVAVVEPLDGGVAIGGFIDFVPGFREPTDQPAPERVVVVGNQDSSHVLILEIGELVNW
jgi:hypothetical protein